MPIKGQVSLVKRLTALGVTPQNISRAWSEETVRLAKERVRVRTGRTRNSIRIASRSPKGAIIVVGGAGKVLEGGTPPYSIPGGKSGAGRLRGKALRFQAGGRTVFSRRVDHPRMRKHPFMTVSARKALRDLKKEIVALWDGAA